MFEVTRYFNLLFKPSQRSLTLQISLIWTPIFSLCGACDTVTTVTWLEFFPQYWIVSTLISYFEVTWHLTITPYPAKSFWAGMRRSKIYGGKIVYEPHFFREGLLGHVPVSIQNSKFWKLIRKQEAFANEEKKVLAKVPQYMGSSDRCCDCQWFKLSRGL